MNHNDLMALSRKYKTPFYCFDTDIVKNQIKYIENRLDSRTRLCFAMKANPFIVESLKDDICLFEVCSFGEFHICEHAQTDMNKVIMSGVYKNKQDMDYTIKTYGSLITYTAESYNQFILLSQLASKHLTLIKVILRLSSGNQFGMTKHMIEKIINERFDHHYIDIEGIQYFSGTQKKSDNKTHRELIMLDEFIEQLKEKYEYNANRIEYGPGLPVNYFKEDKPLSDPLNSLINIISSLKFKGEIVLEIGRYLCAICGYYFTRIVDIKNNNNNKYAIIDGGIHHLNYYGQMMAMKKPMIDFINYHSEKEEKITICGALCTASDVIVKDYLTNEVRLNDILVFQNTGAYSMCEGLSLFLSRALPQVVIYENNNSRLIRNHIETYPFNFKFIYESEK